MVKVRSDIAHNDYRDPGWYQHPAGTSAYEWRGAPVESASAPAQTVPYDAQGSILQVQKPSGHSDH